MAKTAIVTGASRGTLAGLVEEFLKRCLDKFARCATKLQLHKFCRHMRLRTSDSEDQSLQMIRGTSPATTNQTVRPSFPQKTA